MPSGIASVMVASIPIWMTLMETFVLKQTRLHWSLAISITLGLSGVALLALRGRVSGAAGLLPYVVLFFSQISWCIGTLFSKNMRMPSSKPLTAGATVNYIVRHRCGRIASDTGDLAAGLDGDLVPRERWVGSGLYSLPMAVGAYASHGCGELCVCQSSGGIGSGMVARP